MTAFFDAGGSMLVLSTQCSRVAARPIFCLDSVMFNTLKFTGIIITKKNQLSQFHEHTQHTCKKKERPARATAGRERAWQFARLFSTAPITLRCRLSAVSTKALPVVCMQRGDQSLARSVCSCIPQSENRFVADWEIG